MMKPIVDSTAHAMAAHRPESDLIICISHLGWEEKGMGDQQVVNFTRGIDLVLGGHSHTCFTTLRYVRNIDGKPVPDDQNGKSGI